MDKEWKFEHEFSTLEDAMEYAEKNKEKAIITKDHYMYYVVDCENASKYSKLGFDFI